MEVGNTGNVFPHCAFLEHFKSAGTTSARPGSSGGVLEQRHSLAQSPVSRRKTLGFPPGPPRGKETERAAPGPGQPPGPAPRPASPATSWNSSRSRQWRRRARGGGVRQPAGRAGPGSPQVAPGSAPPCPGPTGRAREEEGAGSKRGKHGGFLLPSERVRS